MSALSSGNAQPYPLSHQNVLNAVSNPKVHASPAQKTPPPLQKTTQDPTLPYVLGALGVIIAGSLSFVLWKHYKSPFKRTKKSVSPTGQKKSKVRVDAKEKTGFDSLNKLCQEVMFPGNEGVSCHTMSTLNSLRLYNRLTKFKTSEEKKRLVAVLSGNLQEAKSRAFRFLREACPNQWGKTLNERGQFGESGGHVSSLVPHFLSEYIFDKGTYSTHTWNGFEGKDIAQVLEGLASGRVGTLIGSPWRGVHAVSLVGLHESEEGALKEALALLQSTQNAKNNLHKLNEVKLLIYDQLQHEPSVEALSLGDLFKQDNYFVFHLFKDPSIPIKKQEAMYNTAPTDFLSPQFHQHLMDVGNRVFGVNS